MATIRIKRIQSYFGAVRKIKFWIDGCHLGNVPPRSDAVFEVSEGRHSLQVSMDWCKSVPFELNANADDETIIQVSTAFFLVAMFYVIFKPSRVFTVEMDSST